MCKIQVTLICTNILNDSTNRRKGQWHYRIAALTDARDSDTTAWQHWETQGTVTLQGDNTDRRKGQWHYSVTALRDARDSDTTGWQHWQTQGTVTLQDSSTDRCKGQWHYSVTALRDARDSDTTGWQHWQTQGTACISSQDVVSRRLCAYFVCLWEWKKVNKHMIWKTNND